MNGSSNQLFSKSWQRPGNLAMMASIAAHGVLFAGLALVPATGQQTDRKQLRVVSLLKSQPNPAAQPNQAIDPNAPPPAPGVAGLPLNITTPDGLAELPVTDTPNPAFDPFASSIVELPPPPPQTSFTPFDPNSLAALPPGRPPAPPQQTPPPSNSGPSLSDEDFQAWLNGTSELPNLPPDPGSTGPLPPPGAEPGSVASNPIPPNPATGGIDSSTNPNDSNSLASSSVAPPAQNVKRFVAYDYPKEACLDRLEGKAEYRIWVSSKAAPVVSDIVLSTNSPILDRAVLEAAKKYKIKAEDANKIVILPFDIKYSQSVCAAKEPTPPNPEPDLPPVTPAPTPKPADPATPPSTNTPPENPSLTQPTAPPTPAPQPNLPPVNPAQPAPPTAPQPTQPALPSQPPVQPAPAAPIPSPAQPAVPIQEPPTNSDLPPEPVAPQPAPAPPASPQPPAAAPPEAPSAPAAPPAAPATPPAEEAPAN